MAEIGRSQAAFVYLKLTSLLQLHPYLMGKEPPKEDTGFMAVLLMVLNAAGAPAASVSPSNSSSSSSSSLSQEQSSLLLLGGDAIRSALPEHIRR